MLWWSQLFDQIKADHGTTKAAQFEEKLLRHFQHEAENSGKSKKKVAKEASPLPMTHHQLWVHN
jgi:hypothetical protein